MEKDIFFIFWILEKINDTYGKKMMLLVKYQYSAEYELRNAVENENGLCHGL